MAAGGAKLVILITVAMGRLISVNMIQDQRWRSILPLKDLSLSVAAVVVCVRATPSYLRGSHSYDALMKAQRPTLLLLEAERRAKVPLLQKLALDA